LPLGNNARSGILSEMFDPAQYELLDFGSRRKLERFGPYVLDRPAPAAAGARQRHPDQWAAAHACFELAEAARPGARGRWVALADGLPQRWIIIHGPLRLLGVFAEQAENWDWITAQVRRADTPPKVLNLFAYTGASTLAAAAAGAAVTHVDAARNVVEWARRNAQHSALADRPIRWIVDDARAFVRREAKRGRRYDALILDPPSYAHGPAGQAWRIGSDLPELLALCREVLADRPQFMLLTCHSPTIGPAEAEAYLSDALLGGCGAGAQAGQLAQTTADGRRLAAGMFARWP
jgi:23S rRNA (cytosine1962-C5)-methyltransferase